MINDHGMQIKLPKQLCNESDTLIIWYASELMRSSTDRNSLNFQHLFHCLFKCLISHCNNRVNNVRKPNQIISTLLIEQLQVWQQSFNSVSFVYFDYSYGFKGDTQLLSGNIQNVDDWINALNQIPPFTAYSWLYCCHNTLNLSSNSSKFEPQMDYFWFRLPKINW